MSEKLIKALPNGQWTMDETLEKSGGEGITFKHVGHEHIPQGDAGSGNPVGPIDSHEFHVLHNGKHIGSASAVHESDQLDPNQINVKGRHKYEVKHALNRHLKAHAKTYMDMSPTYGKVKKSDESDDITLP